MVSLPIKKLRLEGLLMQFNKEIKGTSESCLNIKKNPILLRPMKTLRHQCFKNDSKSLNNNESPSFTFKEVNFAAYQSEYLFVLQNKDADHLSVLFEDCHFLNEK